MYIHIRRTRAIIIVTYKHRLLLTFPINTRLYIRPTKTYPVGALEFVRSYLVGFTKSLFAKETL